MNNFLLRMKIHKFIRRHKHIPLMTAGVLLFEIFLFPHAGRAEVILSNEPAAPDMAIAAEPLAEETIVSDTASPQRLPATESLPVKGVKKVVITAYSSTVDQTDDTPFITANGTQVRDGIIAANFLAFGTRVRIPELYGDKVFYVTDRMHERFSNRVDIWMETREEAVEFGVRVAIVEVY